MQKFGLNAGRLAGRLCVRSFCSSAGVPAPSTPPSFSENDKIFVVIFSLCVGTAAVYWTDFLGFRTDIHLRNAKLKLETTKAKLELARLAEAKEFSRTGRTRLPGDEDY